MKRLFFLLYCVICYLVFFGTFLYAIGFVGSYVIPDAVPKSIDSEPVTPLGNAFLINALLLAVFALQHSIMARQGFKRWFAQFVPAAIERSTYVLLSSLCLLLLFRYWQPMGGLIWYIESQPWHNLLKVLFFVGWGIVLVSTFLINHFDLFGLRQVWLYFQGKEYTPLKFKTPFFYKSVRHPLYFGFILAFWATPGMTAAHLFFAIMTTAYILVAIQLEEKDLEHFHGSQYADYKKRAPMIIPFLKFKR